jgi:ribosomal subunit interface protein
MKFSKFEDFIFVMPNMKAEITYYPKNQSYTTSVNVQTKGKGILRAESNAQDILTSINTVTEKMLDQLRRVKTSYEN